MDAWASLEHELRYKRNDSLSREDVEALKAYALSMENVDRRMQDIHRKAKKKETP